MLLVTPPDEADLESNDRRMDDSLLPVITDGLLTIDLIVVLDLERNDDPPLLPPTTEDIVEPVPPDE